MDIILPIISYICSNRKEGIEGEMQLKYNVSYNSITLKGLTFASGRLEKAGKEMVSSDWLILNIRF